MSASSSVPKTKIIINGYAIENIGSFHNRKEVLFPAKDEDVIVFGRNASGKTTSLLALNSAFGGSPPIERLIKIIDPRSSKAKTLEGKVEIFLEIDEREYTLQHIIEPGGITSSNLFKNGDEVIAGSSEDVLTYLAKECGEGSESFFDNSVIFLEKIEENLKNYQEKIEESSLVPTLFRVRKTFERLIQIENDRLLGIKARIDSQKNEKEKLVEVEGSRKKQTSRIRELNLEIEEYDEKINEIQKDLEKFNRLNYDLQTIKKEQKNAQALLKEKEKRFNYLTEELKDKKEDIQEKVEKHEKYKKTIEKLESEIGKLAKKYNLKSKLSSGTLLKEIDLQKQKLFDLEKNEKNSQFKYKKYQDMLQKTMKEQELSNISDIAYKKFEKEKETLEKEIKDLNKKIKDYEASIKSDTNMIKALDVILPTLKEKKAKNCPVCTTPFESKELLNYAEENIMHYKEAISQTKKKIAALKKEAKEISDHNNKLDQLISIKEELQLEENYLKKLKENIKEVNKRLAELKEVLEKVKQLENLSETEEKIDDAKPETDIKKLEKEANSLQREINNLNQKLEQLKAEIKTIQVESNKQKMKDLENMETQLKEAIKNARSEKERLLKLETKLESESRVLKSRVVDVEKEKEEYNQGLLRRKILYLYVQWIDSIVPNLRTLMITRINQALPEIAKKYGLDVVKWSVEDKAIVRRVFDETTELLEYQSLDSLSSAESVGTIIGTLGRLGVFEGKTIFVEAEMMDQKSIMATRDIFRNYGVAKVVFFKEDASYDDLTPETL
ncbi:MAG: AAA family ATPase [Promethearchaeota archaeon]